MLILIRSVANAYLAYPRCKRGQVGGRKNYLFAGSHESAQRIAMIYTITGICKKLGIDPQIYIKHLLTELPKRKANDIEDLLPWNYAQNIQSIPNSNIELN